MKNLFLLAVVLVLASPVTRAEGSTCYGTVSQGRLEGGVRLPTSGPNFRAYSSLGAAVGRTHVHSSVRNIVVNAYSALQKAAPDRIFVYGETGWASGGRIRPHRTHRNGLSVDFMVPVLDAAGRSVPLPSSIANRFGYDVEFDASGKSNGLRIDFDALAEHLFQLDVAARAAGADIALVIFDLPYLPKLWATKRGPYLESHLVFMKSRPWVRHDEHYHVDFAIRCKSG